MEILKGTIPTVNFTLPSQDSSVTAANVSINGAQSTALALTTANGVVSANLPYMDNEGTAVVTWTFTVPSGGTYSVTDTYDIVTPILSLKEVKDITGFNDDQENRNAEAAVRHIINSHCGQTFGMYVGKRSVQGAGNGYLRLPQRLISFTTVNGEQQNAVLSEDGWSMRALAIGVPTIRADWDGWHYRYVDGVVEGWAPRDWNLFDTLNYFEIDGVWGWPNVPEPVREAAKLLVNDYSCHDSIYRDRFVTSISSADWKMQFDSGAFANTGNVRADQLLVNYALPYGWLVI